MLTEIHHGTPGTRPILIAHGLFGSARNWGVIAKRLAKTRHVVAVDMRNHGTSPRADRQDYPGMAADLAEVIEALGGEADVIGHSMGGKAAMMLALTRPERVARLLVADIAPVTYTHSHAPLIAAMRGLDLSRIDSRSAADQALAASIDDPSLRAFLLQSLDLRGRKWRLNLEVLERDLPRILGWPETDAQFTGPTLFLAGDASNYVLAEHRAAIKRHFPTARQAKLPGVGHWLHAEAPRAFEETARAFLGAEPIG
ncbi:MAG: alpha/beta hydrolase [Rhodobacterales bacterium]|nr:MAG: alpha/beta hydrolase [Rhodobacterales bacterium]